MYLSSASCLLLILPDNIPSINLRIFFRSITLSFPNSKPKSGSELYSFINSLKLSGYFNQLKSTLLVFSSL